MTLGVGRSGGQVVKTASTGRANGCNVGQRGGEGDSVRYRSGF